MKKKGTTNYSSTIISEKLKSLNDASSAALLGDFNFAEDSWDNASRYIKPEEKNLEQCEAHMEKVRYFTPITENILFTKSRNEWFWRELVDVLYFRTEETIARIKRLSIPKNKSSSTSVSEEEIQKAKSFPITSLLNFKGRSSICPFHSETSSSLYYYPKTNSAYCFGACQKSYDSIEVYKLLNKCTFVQAVKALQ